MKKVKMNIIETEGFGIETHYVLLGTNYKNGWGLPMHTQRILSEKIGEVDVFELGDRVLAEVHRGSFQNEDGISTGGKWLKKIGVVVGVYGIDDMDGYIKFDDGDAQSVSLIRGDCGYPGRNIQPATDEIIIPEEKLVNYIYEKPEGQTLECPEPYRKGIGQGFGCSEDGE